MRGNIDRTVKIIFTEEEVKDIIKEYLQNGGYEVVGGINIVVKKKTWTDGYGTMEIDHEKLYFENANAQIKKSE